MRRLETPPRRASEWADPMDIELEVGLPQRRRAPSHKARSPKRPNRPLMPTLTLLAAAAAAALSVVDIVTDNVSNARTQVVVSPVDDDGAERNDNHPANDVTVETTPQHSPFVPPIGRSDGWVDECVNAPLTRDRQVAC